VGIAGSLTTMLQEGLKWAKNESTHLVVGIYSVGGWEPEELELIQHADAGKRFLNPNLSLALVGSDISNVIWNPNDPVIADLVHYFRASFEDELAACKETVNSLLEEHMVYLLSNLEDEQGFSNQVVDATVDTLVDSGKFEIIEHNGEKAISRRRE